MDRAFGDSSFSGVGASAPLGGAVAGLCLQRSVDHFGYLVVLIRAGTSRPQLVMQALNAELPVALPPFPYGHTRYAHSLGDGGVRFTGTTSENDSGSLHKRVWH
jgi:hypothetical protein